MIPEILNNLEFFSTLTQSTLSAFHISGTDDILESDIEIVKKYLSRAKYKIIKSAKRINDTDFERQFTDGTTDIVSEEDLTNPPLQDDPNVEIIDNALKKEFNPITHIRYGKDFIEAHNKKIETPTERLFFIDMLDCI